MSRVSLPLIAGALALASTAAVAADLPIAPPPPPPYYAPPPPAEFGGWYLRGDIGMTNQSVKRLENVLYNAPGVALTPVHYEFDSGMTFGVGVGYQFNNWLRGDLTGEYRGKTSFNGLEVYTTASGTPATATDEYRAYKSEWLALANVYADLGTWWCLTPFVGAGAGFSRVTIGGFSDVNTPAQGVAFADRTSKYNFAYALHAGLAYKATNNFTVELAYRYLSLGDGISGDIKTYQGVNSVNNPTTFKDITSHDVRLGVRWQLEPSIIAPPPMPALMRRG